jgi:ATP-dependent DNA helicase RecG
MIEHAESFGLSQLHQLRGRVGRGAAKRYCILMTENLTETARERIQTMERTQDGFEIAEKDLEIRGPGEFFGVKQSGLPEFRVANLLRDREALELARQEARALVDNPTSPAELKSLVEYIREKWQRRYGLVQVG